jgi:hypothetical protein
MRRYILLPIIFLLTTLSAVAQDSRATLFDNNWRFKRTHLVAPKTPLTLMQNGEP